MDGLLGALVWFVWLVWSGLAGLVWLYSCLDEELLLVLFCSVYLIVSCCILYAVCCMLYTVLVSVLSLRF